MAVNRGVVFLALALIASTAGCAGTEDLREVAVRDQVALAGRSVTLTIRTTRLFAGDGGRLAEIFLENDPLGRIMTGGDGYGYITVRPPARGLFRIRAQTPGADASGLLLVMDGTERAVLVEIESALQSIYLENQTPEDCRSALAALEAHYRVIYLTRWLGSDLARNRIAHEKFPQSVVLPWSGKALLRVLAERGIRLAAVVGSPELAAAAEGFAPRRYSFAKAKGAEVLADWRDLSQRLEQP
jgi:hypothetical protein